MQAARMGIQGAHVVHARIFAELIRMLGMHFLA